MTSRKIMVILAFVAVFGIAVLILMDRAFFSPVEMSANPPAASNVERSSLNTQPSASEESSASGSLSVPDTGVTQPGINSTIYRIDSAQSEVRYEVGETFFQDNRFATAVGRTQGIEGEVRVDFTNPSQSQLSEIIINVSEFTSDESRRDNFLRRNALESGAFPNASFQARSVEGLPTQAVPGQTYSFTLTGDLTVRQVTRPVTWQVSVDIQEERLVGTAETEILMSDFGVGPVALAFLRTEDQVRLVFDFTAVAQ